MSLILALAFVPAAWLLQVVAPDFPIPSWLIGSLPVLSYALTELVVRLGGNLTGEQKKALFRAVCLVIVGALVLLGQVTLPFGLPGLPTSWLDPDAVGAFVLAATAYAGAVFGFVWGGGKLLHDLLDAVGVRA
jgi:hypothetical protein